MSLLRVSGIEKESIVDGPGIRYVIFSQGCPHKCKGCHNPNTHDLNGGRLLSTEDITKEITKNPLLKGVTFSGGEPFLQALPFVEIAKFVHEIGLDVVCYTGYCFEEINQKKHLIAGWKDLLEQIDLLVDGPFVLEQRDLTLKFRGSKNQRIIDVKNTLINNKLVIFE